MTAKEMTPGFYCKTGTDESFWFLKHSEDKQSTLVVPIKDFFDICSDCEGGKITEEQGDALLLARAVSLPWDTAVNHTYIGP
jgi:hypothetical protein